MCALCTHGRKEVLSALGRNKLNDYNIEDIIQLFCDAQRYKKKSKPITCILGDNTDDIPSPQDLDESKKEPRYL